MTEKTNFPQEALSGSVQKFPKAGLQPSGLINVLSAQLAHVGNRITPWGINTTFRDAELREFWPTESYFAGALYATSIRNAAFEWEIESPSEKLNIALTDMLNSAVAGSNFGWLSFMTAVSQDFYSQDNGMMIELIRDPGKDAASKFKNENAPVIGIAHLDSNSCVRTGNPKTPIIYFDRDEIPHKMKWWQIIPLAELPSPIESMNGVGWSAISRCLKMAQIMFSIATFKDEKIGGRFFKEMHFVSGVSKSEIDDVMADAEETADNAGHIRFMQNAILASLDPEKPVSTASIEFASLPDGFDLDIELQWYISNIALNLGVDYQDLAPLPSGNIGSAEQSEILHRKSRGKGPAYFMETLQTAFMNYGVIPRPAKFVFKAKDLAEEMEQAQMKTAIAEGIAILVNSGVINGKAARQLAVRSGVLEPEDVALVPDDFGDPETLEPAPQTDRSGNTLAEDAKRVPTSRTEVKEMRIINDAVELIANRKSGEIRRGELEEAILSLAQSMSEKKETPIVVNVPEQAPPTVNVEPAVVNVEPVIEVKVPKTGMRPNFKVNAPDVHVHISDSEETVEVVSRDKEGRVKKVKKTRK